MSEPYSDEELISFLRRQGPDAACGHYNAVLGLISRLQVERDEARRVAWQLGSLLMQATAGYPSSSPEEDALLDQALAYSAAPSEADHG